jgi:hypothetical protein
MRSGTRDLALTVERRTPRASLHARRQARRSGMAEGPGPLGDAENGTGRPVPLSSLERRIAPVLSMTSRVRSCGNGTDCPVPDSASLKSLPGSNSEACFKLQMKRGLVQHFAGLADDHGMVRPSVTQIMRLLQLPSKVKDFVKALGPGLRHRDVTRIRRGADARDGGHRSGQSGPGTTTATSKSPPQVHSAGWPMDRSALSWLRTV